MPNVELLSLTNVIESQRIDFQKWFGTSFVSCPPLGPQITIFEQGTAAPPVSSIVIPGLRIGIYYRMDVSASTTIQGQAVPKYIAKLFAPYFGFVYPVGDLHFGKMIVKVIQPLLVVPTDVEVLSQNAVSAELQRVVNSNIAL